MERIPEPELMEEEEQARAYAEGDFSAPHSRFVDSFREAFPDFARGFVADLGCGPGDVTIRFARGIPGCTVHGVDGSPAMLRHGERFVAAAPDLLGRVRLLHGYLPGARLLRDRYDAVISNSLLHHLPDPAVLWQSVRRLAAPGAPVFVMDLMRPDSRAEADRLTRLYAADEPPVLQRDFFNSLLAAFTVTEVQQQLDEAGLSSLAVRAISDRHLMVAGAFPG